MTSRYFSILAILLLVACNATKKTVIEEVKSVKSEMEQSLDPHLTFDVPMHDFGKMQKGDKASFVYKFKNTGTEDVIIELVSGCNCTTLEWPESETFKPGETGEIKATFDSESEEGAVTKTIDILLENTDPKTGYQIIKEVKYKAIILE